jgi:TPR repeat protein
MIATFRRLLLVSAGAVALSAAGLAQVGADLQKTLSQADAAYERADYAEAVRWYRLAADQGYAYAEYNLGWMYDKGEGVPQNDAEAVRWYRLAADKGYAAAQSSLGWMYDKGEGVPQNDAEAVRWYRLAADKAHAYAEYNLGRMYEGGRGVPQNDAEAVRWYRLAADQGFAAAQSNLGLAFGNGWGGVPQNDAEAVRWYRLAADKGYAAAQSSLGVMYADGQGVPQNDVEAYKWWSLAAAQGDSSAAKNRDIVRRNMTPAQIAEGQRLAAAWKPNAAAVAEPSAAPNKAVVASAVESTGSGFFVTAAGHVLTNAHVVEDCRRVSLTDGLALTVLDIDASSDLALLKTGGASTRTPLMLRQGRGVRLADSVVVAGFPLTGLLSSGLNVTTGAVSALAGPGDDRRLIQITAPVQPGNSGGPLLDSSGNVVGVVVSKLDALEVASITGDIPQNVNFAIALGTLQAFLDSNSIDYQTRASSSPKSNADVAEMARAATVQIECRN